MCLKHKYGIWESLYSSALAKWPPSWGQPRMAEGDGDGCTGAGQAKVGSTFKGLK